VIKVDLNKLNSMTKYPSILTYHKMGERGKLVNEVQVPFDSPAILTEKIDGVNGRIIVMPDGLYIIGSREELLYAKGDMIGNPQLGIVDALKPIAERIKPSSILTVYYFEVYGGNVTKNSKQYTGSKTVGHRLFDIVAIPEWKEILEMPVERIATWRDNGGQTFYGEAQLLDSGFQLTPRINLGHPPIDVKETHDWLKSMIHITNAALDGGALGRPEGIVARLSDRSIIAKLRFEDYERTLR